MNDQTKLHSGWGTTISINCRDGVALAGRLLPAQGTADGQPDATDAPPILVLVHGLGEHSGRYAGLADKLSAAGFHVVGYDHRGHGLSPGKRGGLSTRFDLITDLGSVVGYAKERFPKSSIGLLGHSLGGLIAARYADIQIREQLGMVDCSKSTELAQDRKLGEIQFCALSSPALGLRLNALQQFLLKSLGTFLPKFTVGNGLKPNWLSSDTKTVQRYRNDSLVHKKVSGELVSFMLDSIECVQADAPQWSMPTLLLYATGDRCVDPSGAKRFAEVAPRQFVETHAIETQSHEVLGESDQPAEEFLFNWLSLRT